MITVSQDDLNEIKGQEICYIISHGDGLMADTIGNSTIGTEFTIPMLNMKIWKEIPRVDGMYKCNQSSVRKLLRILYQSCLYHLRH